MRASSTPVTTADKSETVLSLFIRNLAMSHSVNIQAATPAIVSMITEIPKNQTDTSQAGAMAISTSLMIFRVESAEWICGESETVNFSIFRIFSLRSDYLAGAEARLFMIPRTSLL